MSNYLKKVIWVVAMLLVMANLTFARMSFKAESEMRSHISSAAFGTYCIAAHNVGKISLAVTNYGSYGANYTQGSVSDCFTGGAVTSCEYPIGSGTQYAFGGAFWIGAVSNNDTLVTTGADGWSVAAYEFKPLDDEFGGAMRLRSIIDPSSDNYANALSEQDIVSTYADTAPNPTVDAVQARPHVPLGIEVRSKSLAWSYAYAEDFILFDYTIKNVGTRRLQKVYMGIYCDADVGTIGDNNAAQDDICGFLHDIPSPTMTSGNCTGFRDSVKIAWIADNDGDALAPVPVPNVTGTRVIRTPQDTLNISFNWWVGNADVTVDYGPMSRAKVRDLTTGAQGTPEGDRNKYWYMSNGEFDFDQVLTASIRIDDTTWMPPNTTTAVRNSRGVDTRYLLSFGPFYLDPGQEVPLSFGYIGGENFHRDPDNYTANILNAYRPYDFINNLDFSDLGLNSIWASWIYDNPGVDTDGDNYFGKYRVCPDTVSVIDTISLDPFVTDTSDMIDSTLLWYEGDGVPDFSGASPPPSPIKWLTPVDGKIIVRFNGWRSETTEDVFAHAMDFEGYRVYLGLDERPSSMSVIESYDLEDFNKYVYDLNKVGGAGYVLKDNPFTIDSLRILYGGGLSTWNPLEFNQNSPYRLPGYELDSVFYFTKQDYNNSIFGTSTQIYKKYADEPPLPASILSMLKSQDEAIIDSLLADSVAGQYFTDDGYPKYYEYEVVVNNLLPTIPYFINVTAFDFGSPSSGLASLESSPTVNIKSAYPQGPAPKGAGWVDSVYIYPNPYRIDGGYNRDGFEGRAKEVRDKAPDRQRMINFANLPAKCWIRIFTLDGDMVKEIRHDKDINDPLFSHDKWDMITRNTQSVVSGLYYWTVEDDEGNSQIGKLVIIM